jgi:hypothetical protein
MSDTATDPTRSPSIRALGACICALGIDLVVQPQFGPSLASG